MGPTLWCEIDSGVLRMLTLCSRSAQALLRHTQALIRYAQALIRYAHLRLRYAHP